MFFNASGRRSGADFAMLLGARAHSQSLAGGRHLGITRPCAGNLICFESIEAYAVALGFGFSGASSAQTLHH